MFSTTTMASSTSAPSAMAMPPRVMVLMVAPSPFIARIAAVKDSGRATRVIAVERADSRNAKTMAMTSAAPSRKAASRLAMEISMKSAWRNRRFSICMPGGSARWMSAIAASSSRVSCSVLAAGWRWMPSTTAGLPLVEPTPRAAATPSATSAMWRTSTGWPFFIATTASAMSSTVRIRPMPWIRYSCPAWAWKPAAALLSAPATAWLTASMVRP